MRSLRRYAVSIFMVKSSSLGSSCTWQVSSGSRQLPSQEPRIRSGSSRPRTLCTISMSARLSTSWVTLSVRTPCSPCAAGMVQHHRAVTRSSLLVPSWMNNSNWAKRCHRSRDKFPPPPPPPELHKGQQFQQRLLHLGSAPKKLAHERTKITRTVSNRVCTLPASTRFFEAN